MKRALVICALFVVSLVIPTAAEAVGPGVIKGIVTPEAGVTEVEVCVVEQQPSETCTYPAADGSYTLKGVPVGDNIVEFVPSYRSRYVIQYYDHVPKTSEATSIHVDFPPKGALEKQGVDADLVLGGQIEGVVAATSGGAPIAAVEVCAFTAVDVSAGCAQTNAAGEYALPTLPTGNYKVGFFGREASAEFVSEYYGGASTYGAAPLISVSAGATVSNIDAELERGGTISGNVSAAAGGDSLAGIPVCLFAGSAQRPKQCRFSDELGEYSFTGLASGSYQVGFSLSPSELAGGEGVSAGEEDAFLSQYYTGAATRAAATPVTVASSSVTDAVDASLRLPEAPPPAPPVALPVQIIAAAPSIAEPAPQKKGKKCKRGYRKRKVRGTIRCVRASAHRRHHKRKLSKK